MIHSFEHSRSSASPAAKRIPIAESSILRKANPTIFNLHMSSPPPSSQKSRSPDPHNNSTRHLGIQLQQPWQTQKTSTTRSKSKSALPHISPTFHLHTNNHTQDMTYDPATTLYHYPCPCGDRFEIGIEDLRDGEEIAVCPSCSLMIRVIFDVDDLPKPDGGAGTGAQTVAAVGA